MRAFLVAVLLAACSQQNPAYLVEPRDASPAKDAPANVATPDAPVAVDRASDALPATGLRGSYYNGDNFDTLVFNRVDQIIDFPWANDPPDPRMTFNEFSVRWMGTIRPRYSETYTFTVHSGDGSRLTINGTLLIDDWKMHAPEDRTATIQLTGNRAYDIKLDYFHVTGWSVVRLIWESASQSKEVVPAVAFAP
jgi:mannan endo-1,4-beta-mannosidase